MTRIYFHHIPKTAGTSLREYLIARLGERNVAPALRSGRMRDALREYDRFAVITGHLDVIPGDRLPEDRISVTLLREPIDRVVSAFYFERHAYHGGRRSAERGGGDLETWLTSLDEAAQLEMNAQLAALWPLAWDALQAPTVDEQIAAARRALDRFDVVGLQSAMDESLVMIATRAHLAPPDEAPYANRTPGRPPRRELPAGVVRRLEAILAADIEIHEYALRLFGQRRLHLLRTAALSRAAAPAHAAAPAAELAVDAGMAQPPTRAEDDERTQTADRPRASASQPVRIDAVAIRGEISEASYLQVGETAVVVLRIASTIPVDDLNVGFSIRDATDALVFATNTRCLGERVTVSAGSYEAIFRFPNDLGLGDYRISASLHSGASVVDSYLHHVDDACEFFVLDRLTEYFEGRVHLHAHATVRAVSSDGRVETSEIDAPGHERFALLAYRNAALAEFSARLVPLATLPPLRRAADAMLDVEVTNTSRLPWGAFGKRAVAVSYHWLDAERRPTVFDGLRTHLPQDVRPGECVRVRCFVRAPEQPGRMTLVLTLVQEEVAWFDHRDPASCAEYSIDVIE